MHKCENLSSKGPAVTFGIGIDMWLFTTSIAEVEFSIVSMTSKLSEEMYPSGCFVSNLFSSPLSVI